MRAKASEQAPGISAVSRIALHILVASASACLVLLLLLWGLGVRPVTINAAGNVRYVSTSSGADSSNDCLDSQTPCQTITHALVMAVSGNEIRVAEGTYAGVNGDSTFRQSVHISKSVSLRGGFTDANWLDFDPAGNPTIINAQNQGWGVYIDGSNTPISATVEGFTIINGQSPSASQRNGGGIFIEQSQAIIRYNIIRNNQAVDAGGGIFNNNGTALIEENEIYSNQVISPNVSFGGGVGSDSTAGGTTLTLRRNRIYSNTTQGSGGAVFVGQGDSLIDGNIIRNNTATIFGGGILHFSGGTSAIIAQNNMIYGNQASVQGGGVSNFDGPLRSWNNTIVLNTSGVEGGAIQNSGTLLISNTIVISNTAPGVDGVFNDGGTASASYSAILNNGDNDSFDLTETNTQNFEPEFVNPVGNDFHLRTSSALIDVGDPNTTVTEDVDGQGRPFNFTGPGGYDVGADEVYDVGPCFARINNGVVYDDLQTAVNNASAGDTVKVAGYCNVVTFTESSFQILYLDQSLTVRGGYTTTNWNSPTAGPATLDGNGANRVVYIDGVDPITPTIEGFRIINGSIGGGNGAGILIVGSASPVIQNNFIYDNQAGSGSGGGIAVGSGSPTIQFNTLYGNGANQGGGIYNTGGSPLIYNNLVISSTSGVGIHSAGGSPDVRYNDVFGNPSSQFGGGLSDALIGANGNISVVPRFANIAADDFHLSLTSPVVGRGGAVGTPPARDIDGDNRPQGLSFDIGADEATVYAEVQITPNYTSGADPNTTAYYTHTIVNNGSLVDTFDLTWTNSTTWNVTVQPQTTFTLSPDAQATFTVAISVPASATPDQSATTIITATSQTNAEVRANAIDQTSVNISPGAQFTPNFTQNLDPGTVITLTHTLTNTGNYTDTYVITISPASGSWGRLVITAPYTVTLPQNGQIQVPVVVSVPRTAPGDQTDIFRIIAQRPVGVQPPFSVMVTDTINANDISGDRYVATYGTDSLNNCTVPDFPCASVGQGVRTVSAGNTVHVAQGTYQESGISVNRLMTLLGGYEAGFDPQTLSNDPSLTVIDAGGTGRGLFIFNANPTVRGFTIRGGNIGAPGGGIFVQLASPTLERLLIIDNRSTSDGGGLAVDRGTPIIRNNVFYNNRSGRDGGGIYLTSVSTNLLNNTVLSNTAATSGGGIYVTNGVNPSTVSIINTIVASNTAATSGGGVYRFSGAVTMDYNDFFNNSAPASPTSNVALGANSLTADPQLGSDFRLRPGSPAIDTADPNTNNPIDFEGDLRPVDQGFDIGADELAGCLAQLVNTGQVYGGIQEAVDAAPSNGSGVIRVSGYCRGVQSIQVGSQTLRQTVYLTKPLVLSGGWNSTFSSQNQVTTVDAEGLGRVLVITGSISPRIENILLINGNATGLGGGFGGADAGGGVYNFNGTPAFVTVIMQDSQAQLGGGMYNHAGSPTFTVTTQLVEPSQIVSNTAGQNGGGFYNNTGSPWLGNVHVGYNSAQNGAGVYNRNGQAVIDHTDSRFFENSASQSGGGLYNETGALNINRARIYSNTATSNGGGLYNVSSQPFTVSNIFMYNNEATSGNGGGLYNANGSPSLLHLTLSSNRAGGGADSGGGIYNASGSPTIANSIIVGTTAGSGLAVAGGTPQLRYNDLFSNSPANYSGIGAGPGSISTDPIFVDAINGDYHLQPTSPAMDTGDPASSVNRDIDNEIRPSNQGFDIGADEVTGCLAVLNNELGTIYSSAQLAIDASTSATDTVRVSGICRGVHAITVGGLGTVTQTIHLTKNLTIQGGWDETFTIYDPILYPSTLDAIGRGQVVFIGAGVNPTVDSFHIVNGVNGAVFNTSAVSPTVKNSQIYNNTGSNGAAVVNQAGTLILDSNRIFDNAATNGAAFYSVNGTPQIRNSFIYSNTTAQNGTIYVAAGNPTIWHNTFVVNSAAQGSGVYRNGGTPDIRNNIIVNGIGSALQSNGSAGSSVVGYNNLANNSGGDGNMAGSNNVTSLPNFLSEAINDYHLVRPSAAIDAGDPALFGRITADFEGDPRPSHQGLDMGADEVGGCYARVNQQLPIYGSIQYAVDRANSSPFIVDVAGTCYGVNNRGGTLQGVYISKTVTLRGGWSYDPQLDTDFSPTRATTTTIDTQGLGRGIFLTGSGLTPTIDRFRIFNGQGTQGGAIFNQNSNGRLQNNVIYNSTATNGAAIYNNNGNLTIWHNTILSNTATTNGGGVYVNSGSPVIRNNVFLNNNATNGRAVFAAGGSANVDYNDAFPVAANQYSGVSAGANARAVSPAFVSLSPTSIDFVKLPSNSPIIDVGDPASPVTDDFENNPRPSNQGFDMGADEFASCLAEVNGVIYGHVQTAVDASQNGFEDTIRVFGVCLIQPGETQVLQVGEDTIFSGGWNADFTAQDTTTRSVLDANALGRVVVVPTGVTASFSLFAFREGTNANGGGVYNDGTLSLNQTSIFSNTATNGGAIYNTNNGTLAQLSQVSIASNNTSANGGGIYNDGTINSLSDSAISVNTAQNNGGGIYNSGSGVITLIFNTDILSSSAVSGDGGAVYNAGAIDQFAAVYILTSAAGSEGGGIYNSGSINLASGGVVFEGAAPTRGGGIYNSGALEIRNTFLQENQSADGGGLYSTQPVVLTNLYVFSNTATNLGGGIYYNYSGSAALFHNTIRRNSAANGGGGLYMGGGNLLISNTLIIDNEATSGADAIHNAGAGAVNVNYTDFYPDTGASDSSGTVNQVSNIGNFDPQFAGPTSVVILPTSPAIDAGDPNTHVPDDCCDHLPVDYGRPQNNGFDLGAWEERVDFGVLLEPDRSAGADPGTTITLTHYLTNTGELTDTFDLTIDNNPQGWTAQITPTQATLLSNEDTIVQLVVTIPAGAPANLANAITIRAESTINSGVADTAIDTISVNPIVRFEIEPDNEGYGAPGDILTYTHTITNIGNITGTVDIFLVPQAALMSSSLVSVTLAPQQTANLTVTITVPGWLAGGIDDVANVVIRARGSQPFETAVADTTHISYTTGTRFVSLNGADVIIGPSLKDNNCTDPLVSPCRTIAHAISQAAPDDVIQMAGGLYTETIITTVGGGQIINQVVLLNKSVTLRGSFTPDWSESRPLSNTTILQAPPSGRGVYVTGPINAVLDALEITGGDVTGYADPRGAGVYNNGSNLTILASNLHDNQANAGGAIFSSGAITMYSAVLHHNRESALHVESGQATILNNTFYSNTNTINGSAIRQNGGVMTLTNNIFHSNSGGGDSVFVTGGASASIDTNVFYLNNGSLVGTNVYTDDPLLIDPANDNFHLTKGSPAEGIGLTLSVVDQDYEHQIRPQGLNYDIGADEREYQASLLFEPDHITSTTLFGLPITFTHYITNTGETTATFIIDSSSSQGWITQAPTPTITLAPNQSGAITVAITTGSAGGLVDLTVLTATSSVRPDVFATVVNTTTILQSFGVELEPDNARTTATNATVVTYTHILTNSGNGTDTFAFTASSSQGWPVTLPTNVTLSANQTRTVAVTITIPVNSGGLTDVTTITATLITSPTIRDSAVNTTTVPLTRGLLIAPDRIGFGRPGDVITYAHTLTNTGNTTDSFTLTIISSNGWAASTIPPVVSNLNGGASISVISVLTIPLSGVSSLSGTVDLATVTATSFASPTLVGSLVNTTTVISAPNVLIEPNRANNAAPGTVITYSHTVTNTGNLTDTFNFTATSSLGWALNLSTVGPLTLTPGQTDTITVSLTVPISAGGQIDTTTITATSTQDVSIFDTAVDTTTVVQTYGVEIAPDNIGVAPGGATAITYTHMVTNTGNGFDTFAFTASSSQGWSVTVPPNLTLGPNLTANIVLTITIPANSGGLIDTTTITVTSVASPTVRDSAVDTTTVTVTRSVIIAPDNLGTGQPGALVTYNHTVTNTGNAVDSFNLSVVSQRSWVTSVQPPTINNLAPGGTAPVTVTITVPATGPDSLIGVTDVATVTATSVNSPTVSGTAVDTTTVSPTPGVLIDPDQSRTVDAGQTVIYTHTVTNLGNFTDTFTLAASSSQSWPLSFSGPIVLTAGQTGTVTVSLTIPPATPPSVDTTVVTATSGVDSNTFDTATDTTTVRQNFGVQFTPDYTVTTSPTATSITFTHTITNLSNGSDTFAFSGVSSQGWSITLPSNQTLTAGEVRNLVITVIIPAGSGGLTNVSTITATSINSPTVRADVVDTITVPLTRGFLFTPNRSGAALPGTTITYTHRLTNTGNAVDSFNLVISSARGWAVGLNPPTISNLAAGASQPVLVTVTVPGSGPDSAVGVVDTAIVTATSVNSPTLQGTVVDTTTVSPAPGVLLEPDNAGVINPSQTITYNHTITNTGNVTDTFTLSGTSSRGWPITFNSPILLTPGQTGTVTVTVSVPANTGGEIDVTTITATSSINTGVFDRATDTTTVNQIFGVQLTLIGGSTPTPAMTVLTHTFAITNTGNGSDTFAFTATSSRNWTMILPPNLTLPANQVATIVVTITVPAGSGGLTHTLALTATSTRNGANTASASASVTIPLSRGLTFVANQNVNAQPGTLVTFNHTLTNTGNSTDTITFNSSGTQPWTITPPANITLGAGQNANVQVSVQVPANATVGTIDQVTVTAASTFSPTVATQSVVDTITVQSNQPGRVYLPIVGTNIVPIRYIDLEITSVVIQPNPANSGQPATVLITLKNQGPEALIPGNNFFLDFYVDPAGKPGYLQRGDIEWSVQAIFLTAGATQTFTGTYTFTPGTHQIYAQADTDRTVREMNEANNIFGPMSLTVVGTPAQEAPPVEPRETTPGQRPTPTPMP